MPQLFAAAAVIASWFIIQAVMLHLQAHAKPIEQLHVAKVCRRDFNGCMREGYESVESGQRKRSIWKAVLMVVTAIILSLLYLTGLHS